MRKFAKLSLVAAVAVAGFTTTASAGSLENAIKDTSILGYATYRYDDRTIDKDSVESGNNGTYNRYKIALGLVSKITDDLSYTYVGAVTDNTETTSGTGVTYMSGNLHSVYSNFTYTGFQNTSIILGQQGLDTPMTVAYDTIATTQEGTGIAAVSKLGPVTVVAGFMNETYLSSGDAKIGSTNWYNAVGGASVTDNADLYILQASAKLAGVSLDGTYLNLDEVFDAYSLGATTSFDLGEVKLSPYARYSNLEVEDAADDNSLWYVGSKAKMGIFSANIGYGETGKDGGLVAVDNDAEAAFQGWATVINGKADSSILKTNVGVDVLPTVNVALNYNTETNGSGTTDIDTDEVYGQLTWKPAKNFMSYLRYGTVDTDGKEDAQRGRLHVQYTF